MPTLPTPPTPPTTARSTLPNSRSSSRAQILTSTAASSIEFPAPLVDASPSPTARSFSAATVITLSTILPTIILVLLGVILYLLRARRRRSFRSSSKGQSDNTVADIRGDLESPLSDPPFVTLSHHSISPFNVSWHDLGKSLFFGGESRAGGAGTTAGRAPSPVGSTKSHLSLDSGVAHHSDVQLPALPNPAHTRSGSAATPVLAVRYPSNQAASGFRPGHRTSIYVERTSVDSGAASSVVFARERTEEGSTGRASRDGLSRWGSRDARTSLSEFPGRRPSAPSSDQHGTSESYYDGRGPGRSSSKALRLLGIGPSSPRDFPLPARTHMRSNSQPITTYGLPSLQLSPRARALRARRQSPSEANTRGDDLISSSGRVQDTDSRAETQRIHPPLPSSSSPSSSPSTTTTSRPSRERQPLSITIPPRLGAPIRPVAELIAVSPSPPYTHARRHTPRSRSASRTTGIASPSQLSDLGVLERTHAAFNPTPSQAQRRANGSYGY
ncbi:hypothetical protein FRC07_000305 [Ceratobasidium sp. 392]|nr:hypothetical protein FRC07_000305 [Ceratobasidium sp. 392]